MPPTSDFGVDLKREREREREREIEIEIEIEIERLGFSVLGVKELGLGV